MPEYVITARAMARGKREFSDDPGPVQFLEVPDDAPSAVPTHVIKRADWVRKVSGLAGRRKDGTGVVRGDVLVFIHGYNNTLPDVLKRHRRLSDDLPQFGYAGAVVSFDWPSGDTALAYLEDRVKAKMTALALVQDCIELFATLQARPECEINVHLLAHSTGAYVVREAFDDSDDRRRIAAVNWTVSQLVLIAGDVSAPSLATANPESESTYRHCLRLTNYANPFDEVLQISNAKRVGLSSRVGRVGLPADAPAKAVNVDCGEYYQRMIQSRPQDDIIGYPSHSWHIGDPVFTEDLAHTLNGDLDRSAIRTREVLAANRYKLVGPQTLVRTTPALTAPTAPT